MRLHPEAIEAAVILARAHPLAGRPALRPAASACGVRLFVDERLSPRIATDLTGLGHDAIHPLHVGRRGERDDAVKTRCIDEDRVIVTENVGEFRVSLASEDIHPGLIAVPQTSRRHGFDLILAAMAFLERVEADPMRAIVDGVASFDAEDRPALSPRPSVRATRARFDANTTASFGPLIRSFPFAACRDHLLWRGRPAGRGSRPGGRRVRIAISG